MSTGTYNIRLAFKRGVLGALTAFATTLGSDLVGHFAIDWKGAIGYALAGFGAGLAVDAHAFVTTKNNNG